MMFVDHIKILLGIAFLFFDIVIYTITLIKVIHFRLQINLL